MNQTRLKYIFTYYLLNTRDRGTPAMFIICYISYHSVFPTSIPSSWTVFHPAGLSCNGCSHQRVRLGHLDANWGTEYGEVEYWTHHIHNIDLYISRYSPCSVVSMFDWQRFSFISVCLTFLSILILILVPMQLYVKTITIPILYPYPYYLWQDSTPRHPARPLHGWQVLAPTTIGWKRQKLPAPNRI